MPFRGVAHAIVRDMTDISVIPQELRDWAKDCGAVATRIEQQLKPAESACEDMRNALDGWAIADGVSDLRDRWEELNELLRDELDEAADSFEKSADQYDDDENRIIEWFRHLF
ncbi:hypothetical protein MOQ72_42900 [Saccharopolyspora sp. K220]|uniref:WXG100 family type VII secretion target n=1 Tax=Saccharopolyspora soli TaxID=2926618 RepID=UPI001F588930|nr:hypothetical protein [Saccharopolyspora soli]MCI2424164.1 hypothetical protein [Saccharopolyspora soli]